MPVSQATRPVARRRGCLSPSLGNQLLFNQTSGCRHWARARVQRCAISSGGSRAAVRVTAQDRAYQVQEIGPSSSPTRHGLPVLAFAGGSSVPDPTSPCLRRFGRQGPDVHRSWRKRRAFSAIVPHHALRRPAPAPRHDTSSRSPRPSGASRPRHVERRTRSPVEAQDSPACAALASATAGSAP